MTTVDAILGLDADALAAYIRSRLRGEVVDPPLGAHGGEEAPSFILRCWRASRVDADFRKKLAASLKRNLIEIVTQANAQGGVFWQGDANNEWLAGVAFLISEIGAQELLGTVEIMVAVLFDRNEPSPTAFGPIHLLRALAFLQTDRSHADLWRRLWAKGANWLRPLVLFGWSRCEPEEAVRHVGELLEHADPNALPAALNALLQPGGLTVLGIAKTLRNCDAGAQQKARTALRDAGCDDLVLNDFEAALLSHSAVSGGFPFPVSAQQDPRTVTQFVGWDVGVFA